MYCVDLGESFPVSPHVPFLNLLFEQIAYSNEYLLAKIGFDTAENEPFDFHNFSSLQGSYFHRAVVSPALVMGSAFWLADSM